MADHYRELAQLEERRSLKAEVLGSKPRFPANNDGMAERPGWWLQPTLGKLNSCCRLQYAPVVQRMVATLLKWFFMLVRVQPGVRSRSLADEAPFS